MPAAPGNAPSERIANLLSEIADLQTVCDWFVERASLEELQLMPPMPSLIAYRLELQRQALSGGRVRQSRVRMAHKRARDESLDIAQAPADGSRNAEGRLAKSLDTLLREDGLARAQEIIDSARDLDPRELVKGLGRKEPNNGN